MVAAQDGRPFVVTAFHVVAEGGPITVEREVSVDDTHDYVEAFPAATVAAFDEDADLAVLSIRNLPRDRIQPLKLATDVKKDAEVVSWGFPASSVIQNLGLTNKHGRLSNLVKLRVVDRLYARVIRDDAIDGLIVSTDLEPGFSGGPTTDTAGNVVGVNVIKDEAHRGQNAAVHVSVLRNLLGRMTASQAAPKPDDVVKLLTSIEGNYLRLPAEQRHEVRPTEIIALGDLHAVSSLAQHLRTYLWAPSTSASIGMVLARMSGETLPTFLHSATRTRVNECEKAEGAGLGGLAEAHAQRDCRDLEVRPLTWDFVSATLQWMGEPRTYTVSKVEEVNAERRIYRAQVGVSNRPSTFAIYVSADGERLRLRLTDANGKLYALSTPNAATADDFLGRWKVAERRVTSATRVTRATSESLEIASSGGQLVANHAFLQTSIAPQGNTFVCNGKAEVLDPLSQTFSGKLENGIIAATPSRRMTRGNSKECPERCGGFCSSYSEDAIVTFKRVGPQLVMYRTSGEYLPEAQHFVRDQQ